MKYILAHASTTIWFAYFPMPNYNANSYSTVLTFILRSMYFSILKHLVGCYSEPSSALIFRKIRKAIQDWGRGKGGYHLFIYIGVTFLIKTELKMEHGNTDSIAVDCIRVLFVFFPFWSRRLFSFMTD